MDNLSIEVFNKCLEEIVKLSGEQLDGWALHRKENIENGTYVVKKQTVSLSPEGDSNSILATFEYHIAYNLSYGVPVLCFNIWRQDGTFLSLEEYWKLNEKLKEFNIYETLTQMDHPILCRPFLTLHPCRTQEILRPFLEKSKNPVISWLSVVGPLVHLELLDQYLMAC